MLRPLARSGLVITLITVLARAAEPPPPASQPAEPEAPSPFDLRTTSRLTGDWGGARSWLEEQGVELNLGLTTVFQQNAHGGLRTHHAHRVSGSYDLELNFDLEKLKLVPGGMVYVLAGGSWDDGVSGRGYVGDLFGVNGDAGGDRSIDVYELWYEQQFFDEHLRVRFGKLDLSVDFDTNAFANDETSQFLNCALINTGNIPFPECGQGLQLVATPFQWLYFGAGVADASADARETGFRTAYHGSCDLFSIYELGLTPTWETPLGRLPGGYRVGLWYDPQVKDRYFNDLGGRLRTVPTKRDDLGFYVNCDQVVLRENPATEGDEQGLGLFARFGYAPDDVNAVEYFWSVGGQYRGLIPTRDDDVLAVGAAQGYPGDDERTTGVDPHHETVIETYYNFQLFPWLSVTPDFQWILRPGAVDGRDAFVAGLRLQMSF